MPRLRISLASLLGFVAVHRAGARRHHVGLEPLDHGGVDRDARPAAGGAARRLVARGARPGFWAGFALFGWTYLDPGQLGLGRRSVRPRPDGRPERPGRIDVRRGPSRSCRSPPAPASRLPDAVADPPYPPTVVWHRRARGHSAEYLELVAQRQIKIGNFVQIGRLALSLAFGLLGGFIATALAEGGSPPRRPRHRDVPSRRSRGRVVGRGSCRTIGGSPSDDSTPRGSPDARLRRPRPEAGLRARLQADHAQGDVAAVRGRPRRLRRVPRHGQADGEGGEARPGQGQDPAPARPGGAGRRRVSPVVAGLRVRPPALHQRAFRADLHLARRQRRRLHRR